MPPVVTREMVKQYKQSDGGVIPDGLYIVEVPKMKDIIRRYDTPMLKLVKPGESHNQEVWRYGEGDLLGKSTTVSGAHGTTATVLTLATNAIIQKWQKLRIKTSSGSEQLLVLDPEYGTNQVLVSRNWPAGGAGLSLAGGETVLLLGPAIPEGADAVDSPIQMGEVFETYPNIYEYTWKFSHRARVTPDYEVQSDKFKAQRNKKMKEAAMDLNRDLLSALKNKGDATGSNPSSIGGLREATATYTQNVGGNPLTWLRIMNLLQTVYIDVGADAMGKTFMGSFFQKRIFNSFFQKSRRSGTKDDKLKLYWDEVDSDFGVLKFVINYEMDDDELICWNPEDASLDHYEGGNWSTGLYSTQGWYDRGFLRGDFGAIFEAARRRCRWHTIDTNTASYTNLDVPATVA